MKASATQCDTAREGGQLDPGDLALLNKALDDLMESMSNNHLPFLGTDGQRQGLLYTTYNDLFRAMQRARTCCYPGCGASSIPKSHTLQRAGPLSFIAEDSHVITPSFAPTAHGCYTALRVGLNEASTFPGFCLKHEAIFDFEAIGDLRTDRHVKLQVFRTICREVTAKQIHLTHLRKLRERHDNLLSQNGLEFLRRRLGDAFVKKHGLRNLTLDHVSRAQAGIEECEGEVSRALHGLQNEFLPAAAKAIEGRGDDLYHVSVTVRRPLPVCLAGVANFWIDDHGQPHSVQTILNVIPSSQKTLVVGTCLALYRDYLHATHDGPDERHSDHGGDMDGPRYGSLVHEAE